MCVSELDKKPRKASWGPRRATAILGYKSLFLLEESLGTVGRTTEVKGTTLPSFHSRLGEGPWKLSWTVSLYPSKNQNCQTNWHHEKRHSVIRRVGLRFISSLL